MDTPTLVLGLFMLGNDNTRCRNDTHVKFHPRNCNSRVVEDYFLGTNGQLFIVNAHQLHRDTWNDEGRRSSRVIALNCNFTNKLSLTKPCGVHILQTTACLHGPDTFVSSY